MSAVNPHARSAPGMFRPVSGVQNTATHEQARADLAVLNAVQFNRELQRQRARADRSQSRFVLALFRVALESDDLAATHIASRRLARVLDARARLSDVVGWYVDASVLGIILPDAEPTRLEGFVQQIEQTFLDDIAGLRLGARVCCDLYNYPNANCDSKDEPANTKQS